MKPKTEPSTASLTVIGVDIGKVFHIVGFGVDGKIAFRKKIRRLGLKDAFEKLQPCIVGMEACLNAHCQQSAPRTRTRAADHTGDLRQTVHEGAKERLQ
jgi:transposase